MININQFEKITIQKHVSWVFFSTRFACTCNLLWSNLFSQVSKI